MNTAAEHVRTYLQSGICRVVSCLDCGCVCVSGVHETTSSLINTSVKKAQFTNAGISKWDACVLSKQQGIEYWDA